MVVLTPTEGVFERWGKCCCGALIRIKVDVPKNGLTTKNGHRTQSSCGFDCNMGDIKKVRIALNVDLWDCC